LNNRLGAKANRNKDLDIFKDESNRSSPFSSKQKYGLAYWWIKHNLSRAGINELFRDRTMPTVSNFTSSDNLFKSLHKIPYGLGIVSWISGKVCYNHLANPNNPYDNDFTCYFYRTPAE
jgi:hypothetical protein